MEVIVVERFKESSEHYGELGKYTVGAFLNHPGDDREGVGCCLAYLRGAKEIFSPIRASSLEGY